MKLLDTPPTGWDERIAFPLQSVGFAHAARALGHRPLFAEDERGTALVLVRQVPIPILRAWTARAKVYAHAHDVGFLPMLVDRLRALGVSHVKLGDSIWGMSGPMPEGWRALQPLVYHVFVNDLRAGEAALLARAARAIRRHVRKAAEDVTVSEVRTPDDLRDYLSLAAQTGLRMRFRDLAAVYPPSYFEAILQHMVPRRQAMLFIARSGDTPLAGGAFVTNSQRFVHIHGCSTRDRALTPKQGPTAIFWHAMRTARAAGCVVFDMGAVTPTDDPNHPHYSVYAYKKLWGGQLVELQSAELVVSPWKYRFQESVLAPMWDRVHPVYLRLFGERAADAGVGALAPGVAEGTAATLLELSGQEQRS